ncbi:UDP-N-acetylmuramate--L-alanine ligase [Neomoorella thermoacetica]|uniref:UDP-N-acetylmuramate--L-alanine ligase n=1 Tax=Neomoorella thermoacetica TaxID=1525 RepID=UPI0008FA6F25|nr:UDP-N-acetylmuramate--L-alanine ligase [Moorella thermoacetica]
MADLETGGWTHFVGIGGVGMSALARILLAQGYRVSGSDPKENQFTRSLEAAGAIIYHQHDAANLAPGVQEVVISSAVPSSNPEVVAARQRSLPVVKRGELLARLFNARRGIAVAGAHGKTTTSALVALVMKEGGLEPAAVIGGYVREFASNAYPGRGDFLVAEADESDGSFLWLKPEIALITNIEADHLEHYGSLDRIVAAFKDFIDQIRPGGKAILCAEDPRVAGLVACSPRQVITYGLNGRPDYRATGVQMAGMGGRAAIYYRDQYLGQLTMAVPGRHNILNALGAIAAGHQLGIPFAVMARALGQFRGVGRRFEILWDDGTTRVVDDYAHHPTEIRATLAAASQVGAKRVVAVFQPHRYTRTHHLYREFGQAFRQADIVIVNDIYPAGEAPLPGVNSQLITGEIKGSGHQQVYYLPTLEETLAFLKKSCRPGDLVLTLGAGDVWRVGMGLAQYLEAKQILPGVGA